MAGSFCNVIAVTSVLNFLCLQARYTCGASRHTSTHVVHKYIMWAGVENRNEPFVGFTKFLLLVCYTTEKKGELGEPGTQEEID